MRKFSFKAAGAIAFGLSLSAALPTYAAAYEVSQADFDAAIGGEVTKNIDCSTAPYCVGEGDYTLTENVSIVDSNYSFGLKGDSSLDLGGNTFTGSISNPETASGAKVTISNGTIDGGPDGGEIAPVGSELTLSDVTANNMTIRPNNSTVNIESGTYTTSTFASVIDTDAYNSDNNSTINITGGTFKTTNNDQIPVIMATSWQSNTEINLNISGGTFTSAGGMAVMFANADIGGGTVGTLNANISGGTFTGKTAGLSIADPSLNNIKLSGGTYNYTDTETKGNGAIVSWDGKAASITGLLADGYHFTNNNIAVVELDGMGGGTAAVIVGNTEVTADESEEKSSNSGLKSPNTGAFTHETAGATATNGAFVIIIAAAALGLLGYKKFSNRK